MTTKTAQFTPPDCPICRERHEANRSLSYDGRGINSCGMYRNRIATFQHSDDVARELGPKFAAALALYEALQIMVRAANVDEIDPLVMFASIERARHVLKLAEGKSA